MRPRQSPCLSVTSGRTRRSRSQHCSFSAMIRNSPKEGPHLRTEGMEAVAPGLCYAKILSSGFQPDATLIHPDELLRAVDIRDRDDDDLELHVNSRAARVAGRIICTDCLGAHGCLLRCVG